MKATWLFDEHPLIIDVRLAKVIGLNKAIVLQQLNYWLHSKSSKEIDGKKWIYNSVKAWNKQFPFWGKNTVQRALDALEKEHLVVTGNFNKYKFDRTKWYSINENELVNRMTQFGVKENTKLGKSQLPNLGKPIPDTNTDTNSYKDDDDPHRGSNPFDLAYMTGINVNSGTHLPIFTDYISRLGNDLVCYAIQRTGDLASHPNWTYLTTILKSLEDNHVKTVKQAEELSTKRGQANKRYSKKTQGTNGQKYKFQIQPHPEGMTQSEAIAEEIAKEAENDRKERGDS